MSSIDHEHEREIAEAPAEHTSVADGSVVSDTETARNLISYDANKDIPESPHHVRSNSIKKPATFKAVSVTKNFLAKARTPPTPNAKVNGDKGKSDRRRKKQCPDLFSHVCHRNNDRCSTTSTTTCRKVCKWPPGLRAQVSRLRL